MINSFTYAIKFIPEGGKVLLKVCVNKLAAVLVQVSITGIGIAVHHNETIIEPLGKIRNALELSSEATGLGLPL